MTADAQEQGTPFSLRDLTDTLGAYKWKILLSVAAIMTLYAIIAVACYLAAPVERFAARPFRIEFASASNGEYPNGTKFSYTDVVATPILMEVFTRNQLQRFLSFDQFKSAVFVLESNPALISLDNEYQARIADQRLTSVDRQRLETEYAFKRNSITHSQYALNMVLRGHSIPSSLVDKTLDDILKRWAEMEISERGVLRFPFPLLSSALSEPPVLASQEPIVALDRLHARVKDALLNINNLAVRPGADVVRARGREGVSLADYRERLEVLQRFRVDPLVARLLNGRVVANPIETLYYFEAQLDYNRGREMALQSESAATEQALQLYIQRAPVPASLPVSSNSSTKSSEPKETVMPQLTDAFLDRLSTLVSESADKTFRQQQALRIQNVTINAIPYHAEVTRYTAALEMLRARAGFRAPTPGELSEIGNELTQASNEFIEIAKGVDALYSTLVTATATSSSLYSLPGPVSTGTERVLSIGRLALWGLFVLLIAFPAAVTTSLLHNRLINERRQTYNGS